VILVVCDEMDVAASWAADGLRKRGLSPTVLTGTNLASVLGWRHSIGAAGADIEMRFEGGVLHGRDVRAVLNRLSFLPGAWLKRTGGPDREYAVQEMLAFYLSWLQALAVPKLNPPTPQGLCGNMRHPSAWVALAARSGVPVRPFRQSSDDDPAAAWQTPVEPTACTIFVVGAEVVGPAALAAPYRTACIRFAQAAGCPLLGIDFARCADGVWRMNAASVIPDLTRGGNALLDSLARALTS
jgi:hypothetical protein